MFTSTKKGKDTPPRPKVKCAYCDVHYTYAETSTTDNPRPTRSPSIFGNLFVSAINPSDSRAQSQGNYAYVRKLTPKRGRTRNSLAIKSLKPQYCKPAFVNSIKKVLPFYQAAYGAQHVHFFMSPEQPSSLRLVRPWADGLSLIEYFEQHSNSPFHIAQVLYTLLVATHCLHQHFIHGDIHHRNMAINTSASGVLSIIFFDFDWSYELNHPATVTYLKTKAQKLKEKQGTVSEYDEKKIQDDKAPYYWAPERCLSYPSHTTAAQHPPAADPRQDLWSVVSLFWYEYHATDKFQTSSLFGNNTKRFYETALQEFIENQCRNRDCKQRPSLLEAIATAKQILIECSKHQDSHDNALCNQQIEFCEQQLASLKTNPHSTSATSQKQEDEESEKKQLGTEASISISSPSISKQATDKQDSDQQPPTLSTLTLSPNTLDTHTTTYGTVIALLQSRIGIYSQKSSPIKLAAARKALDLLLRNETQTLSAAEYRALFTDQKLFSRKLTKLPTIAAQINCTCTPNANGTHYTMQLTPA